MSRGMSIGERGVWDPMQAYKSPRVADGGIDTGRFTGGVTGGINVWRETVQGKYPGEYQERNVQGNVHPGKGSLYPHADLQVSTCGS